ncbi:hypothetical protein EP30_02375 [Bifidobacterium sp. UTCIF-39]|uniref:phage major capsid protein n=1 Tax=Bifidobacterium sp. UTCIF-39 TaxID=1465359 RepID=UPI00112A5D57|nr:phage major capsid protein [Bifidobacterium sp. UTCIF-39]TPF97459.1 hypothetical protein EP30_02375 [Bifidobacterium sp. UTCIF-39]
MVFTTNFDTENGRNVAYYSPTDVLSGALVITQSTVAASIEGDKPTVVVPYVAVPSTAEIVAEGATFNEGETNVNELAFHTKKIGVLNVLSRETSSDSNLSAMISNSLIQAVVDKADTVLLQNPAPEDGQTAPTGLFNTPGVVTGTMTGHDGFNGLIAAIAAVTTNGGTPTAFIMNYVTWGKLLQFQYNDGRPLIDADAANNGQPMIYGIPVILNRHAPDNKILVNDKANVVSAAGAVSAQISLERYFEKDSVGARVTFRFGFGVIRPDRIAVVTITEEKTTK